MEKKRNLTAEAQSSQRIYSPAPPRTCYRRVNSASLRLIGSNLPKFFQVFHNCVKMSHLYIRNDAKTDLAQFLLQIK
jgi:hypothetical protein